MKNAKKEHKSKRKKFSDWFRFQSSNKLVNCFSFLLFFSPVSFWPRVCEKSIRSAGYKLIPIKITHRTLLDESRKLNVALINCKLTIFRRSSFDELTFSRLKVHRRGQWFEANFDSFSASIDFSRCYTFEVWKISSTQLKWRANFYSIRLLTWKISVSQPTVLIPTNCRLCRQCGRPCQSAAFTY